MNRQTAVILVWLAFGAVLHAEQLRIAVAVPEVVADSEQAKKEAAGYAYLWQSLVVTELSRREMFAVVDRDDLAALAKEWALKLEQAKSGPADNRPTWQGADCLVIGNLSAQGGKYELAVRVINTRHGAVEQAFTNSVAPSEIEAKAREFAPQLETVGRVLLSQRDIHTLVSVLDFESQGAFPRSQWQDRALARRVRNLLMREPGVLVLEREDMSALYTETRLNRGGLTRVEAVSTNRWARLRNYFLVTGSFKETQPQGQPLSIQVAVQIKNLDGNQSRAFDELYPFEESDSAMNRISIKVRDALASTGAGNTLRVEQRNRSDEAEALLDRVYGLMRLESSLRTYPNIVWGFPAQTFSPSGSPYDVSVERKAMVLRALHYLQSAWIADPGNPRVGALLSSVLLDRQVGGTNDAIALAEEVAWNNKAQQSKAWYFLWRNTTGEKNRLYRQLLLDSYPRTPEARRAISQVLRELTTEHRNDADLSAAVETFQAWFEMALSWGSSGGSRTQSEVNSLFELTQTTGNELNPLPKTELRDPTSREMGTRLLEDMIKKYPQHAFNLVRSWSEAWERYSDDDKTICYWLKRAADMIPEDPHPNVRLLMGFSWDIPRRSLATRLMARGQFKEALPYLLKITSQPFLADRDFRIGRCAFETGDYALALEHFERLGSENKEGVEWAKKCRERLGPAVPTSVKPYSLETVSASPRIKNVPLPRGVISDMELDGSDVWIGLRFQMYWSDANLAMLDNEPQRKENLLKAGGLVRFNTATGKTTSFAVGKELSHPWVTSVAVADNRVWVGTYGQGVDVFDKATDRWSNFNETNGMPMNFIQCLAADRESLWVGFGRYSQGGVARFIFNTGSWQTFLPTDYPARQGPPTNRVVGMKSVAGNVWCLTDARSDAVYRYDVAANRWQRFRNGQFSVSLGVVAGRVWFGPEAGGRVRFGHEEALLHFRPDGSDDQTIRKQDGMPDIPVRVVEEFNGKLLLGGSGLMILDLDRMRFERFKFPDQAGIRDITALLAVGDEIWIGTYDPQAQLQTMTPARALVSPAR